MCGLLLLASSPVVPGQIVFNQNFESGSLDVTSTTVSDPGSSNPTVTLVPRYNGSEVPLGWWWMYFSVSGVTNKTPIFRASTTGSTIPFDNQTRWVYSYDQVTWQFFANGSIGGGYFTFSNNTAFQGDTVYIATAIPYGQSRTTALINSIKNNSWVLPTVSSDTNLVVGHTLGTAGGGYRDDLGRVVAAQNLYGFKVTDPSVTGSKTKIVLTSGNHSGEPPGTMTLEGLVNFLISTDPRMQKLRQQAEFYIYPQTDPEGRVAGYYVSTPQNPTKNHNRFWNNPAGFTDITTIENAMKADTGGKVDYFLDFHSEWQPNRVDVLSPPAVVNSWFAKLLKARDAFLSITPFNIDFSAYAQGWGGSAQGLGATYTITVDLGTLAGAQQNTWDHIGQDFALAFYDLLASGAPIDVTATAGEGQVALGWTATAGAVSYNVKRSTTSGGPYTVVGNLATNAFTDTAVTAGTPYYYVVSTLSTNGESQDSLQVSATPLPVPDRTPPSATVVAPADGQVISNIVTVSATATDNVAVATVQFQLDGAALGAALSTPPYAITWDTVQSANGLHTLTAVASDAASNRTTSVAITVTVSNRVSAVTGLVGFWTFDPADVSGNTLFDRSGNGSHATSYNTTSVSGPVGSARHFTGAASYAVVPADTNLRLTGDRTLALWLRTSNASRYEGVISRYDAAGMESGYLLRTTAAGVLDLRIGGNNMAGGGGRDALDTRKINDGVWHQVVVIIKLGSGVTFYVDGVRTSVTALNILAGTAGPTFQLGQNPYLDYGNYFTGDLDELQVFNHALTDAEVAALGQAGDSSPPTVALTAPANNQTLSNSVTVSATATDDVGVVGVQFKVDGANLGAEDTTAPYAVTWDTTTLANGSHTLSAVARDAVGHQTTGAVVAVTVANPVLPPTVTITAPANGQTVSNSVNVTASASASAGVVGVQFKLDGANLGAEDTTAPYAIAWNTIPTGNGAHALTAVARDTVGNATTSTPVSVTVSNDLTAPVVAITAPAPGQVLSNSVTVSAAASDDVGVAGVQFKLDGANLGAEDSTPPYSVSWNTAQGPNGSHSLTAIARDTSGNPGTSTVVVVTVNNDLSPPVVALTAPANNQTVSNSVTVSATATDDVGVVGVQFKVDGANLGAEDTTAPYAVAWDTTILANGLHTLSAVARDAVGHQATGTVVAVTVANPVLPPTVTITAPANGQTVIGSVNVTANASGSAGVAGVQFKLDATNLGAEDTAAPYAIAWNTIPTGNGTHALTAVARDTVGNATTSTPVSVTVSNDLTAPVVAITAPIAGQVLSNSVAVSATATDNVAVVGVQFKVDGVNLGAEDVLSPYVVTWDTTQTTNGPHTLTAVARDAAGNQTNALAVAVTVSNAMNLTTGLAGYWSFDPVDVNGNTLYDRSGNGSDATAYNTSSVNGPAGSARRFTGSASYALVAADTNLRLTGDRTLALWLRTSNTSRYEGLISRYSSAGSESGYLLRTTAAGVLDLRLGGNNMATGASADALDTRPINDGVWHHVVVVIKLGTGVTFYIDGVRSSSIAIPVQAGTGGATFQMAANPWLEAGNYFTGDLDEMRIYNRVLVDAEVAVLARPGAGDTTPPTVSLTAPADGQTVTGSVTVAATASDDVGVAGVQFKLDGANLGAEDGTPPYSVSWNTAQGLNGSHSLTAIARDTSGNLGTSTVVVVTVNNDLAPPAVTLTAPANNQTVSNSVTVSATATDDVGVVGVQFKVDGVNLGAEDTIAPYAVAWDTTILVNGAHTLSAVARDAVGHQTTGAVVAVTVANPALPPTVTITAPANGQTISNSVNVTANASGSAGVVGVQFRLDGANLGVEDTVAPYSTAWNTTQTGNGPHALSAVARDTAGNATTSTPVSVTVSNDLTAPVVAITAPAPGQVLSNSVTVSATASDNAGVAGVQFKLDGANLGAEDATAPYSVSWNTAQGPNGSHSLTAIARDTSGNLGTSTVVVVTATNDLSPPVVALTAPANNQTVSNTVTVSATATDDVGVIGVQFKVDGANLGAEDTSAPYAVAWDTTTLANGAHTLSAVARDAVGHQTTGIVVAVTVANPLPPPTVTITAPANGQTVSNSVNVTANASGSAGVVGVQFKLDGANLGAEDTAAPYAIAWNTTQTGNGTHALTAVARDTAGNATTSTPVSVAASNDLTAPVIAITTPAPAQVLSNSVTVSATATDNVAVVGVQFKLDGANLGAEVSTPPYLTAWNTKQTTNGTHTLTAVARDAAANQTTSDVIAVTVSNTVTLTDGLVGYWSFDPVDVNGNTLYDRSGNGSDATAYNTSSVNGPAGSARRFTGAGSYALVAADTNLRLAGDRTLALWLRTSNTSRYEGLISRYAAAGNESGYLLRTTAAGVLDVLIGGANVTTGASRDALDTRPINDGVWHHVVVVIKLGTGVTFYIDGVRSSTTALPVQAGTGGATFQMGANPWLGYGNYFTGDLDEMRVYNRVLADGEVAVLAQSGAGRDNIPPTVSLTAPADGQTVTGAVTVAATASDDAGVIGVQFKLDGANLGAEDSTPPYSVSWNTAQGPNGSHSLTAIARDTSGNPGTSTVVVVTVNNDLSPPSVALTAPANNQTVSNLVTVSATATDDVGVVGVQFKVDGANLGAENTTAPYAVAWDTTSGANGAHTLSAVARDAVGHQATGAVVAAMVANPVPPPTVTITAPANGQNVTGSVNVAANAAGSAGVAGVQFKLDGVNLGAEDTTAPYSIVWNTMQTGNGAHALTAVARDTVGNTTTSTPVSVTASNDLTPPAVAITAPVPGQVVSNSVTVSATATDNVAVVGVQFKLDGANLGAEVSTPPYQIAWNTKQTTNGTHLVTAVARDAAANQTTSDVIAVTVSNMITLTDGLVGYWSFDPADVNGSTLYDRSGNGSDATAYNTSSVYGPVGSARRFTGSGSYALVAADTNLRLTGDRTLALWLRTSNTSRYEGLMSRYASAGNESGYLLRTTAAGVLDVLIGGANLTTGASRDALDTRPINDGVWHHVAVVIKLGTGVTFYIDGVRSSSTALPIQAGTGGANFQMGSNPWLGYGNYFTGDLDEMRVYSRVLADAEVAVLAQPSGGRDNIPPTVSLTAPADGQTVTGAVTVAATAADDAGVAGVQFKLDGANLGAEDSVPPYSASWDTAQGPNGSHSLTAIARDTWGNPSTSTVVVVMVNNDLTPPVVALTAPADSQSVSNIVTVSATATDNVGVVGVQFKVDGANLGAEDTTTPYAVVWDTSNVLNGSHTLSAVARDAVGHQTTGAVATVTVANTVLPPTVALTAPVNGQTLSGSIAVSASASANTGVAGVQFQLDGANLGSEDTAAPYGIVWNTIPTANGAHALTAVARDTSGNATTSTPVNVTVSNTITLTDGLLGFWSFDAADVNGNTLYDRSGNGSDAVGYNTTAVTGKVGQARHFTGTGSYVLVSSDANLRLTGDRTLSLWLRTTNTSRYEGLISRYDASGLESGYLLRTTPSGVLELRIGGNNLTSAATRNLADVQKINDGAWHHVVVIIKLGSGVTFYIDGARTSTTTAPVQAGVGGATFQIGSNPWLGYGNYFTGDLDQVRVHDRTLSDTDIAALYQEGVVVSAQSFNILSSFRRPSVELLDTDGDGLTDVQETLAGTDPTQANSRLRMVSIVATPAAGAVALTWTTVPGQTYQVQYTDTPGGPWHEDLPNSQLTAGPGQFSLAYTDDDAPPAGSRYYTVRLVPGAGAPAVTVATEPVGVYGLTLQPGDNPLTVPLQRLAEYRGAVVSTVNSNTVRLGGTAGFVPDQFGPRDGLAQYILLVRQDATATPGIAGDWWPITGNTATQITVENGPDDLTNLLAGGSQIEIRHLTTLSDLFGSALTASDRLWLGEGVGIGWPVSYQPGGATAGYYQNGTFLGNGSTITLAPDQALTVSRPAGSASVTVRWVGQVQVTPLTHYLEMGVNLTGNLFPVAARLDQSGLASSGWVADANLQANAAEEDLFQAGGPGGLGAAVYYHNGTLSPAGWYVGGVLSNGVTLAPGQAYRFSIKPGSGMLRWRQPVPFTP